MIVTNKTAEPIPIKDGTIEFDLPVGVNALSAARWRSYVAGRKDPAIQALLKSGGLVEFSPGAVEKA